MHFCRAGKDSSLEKLSLITLFLLQIRTRSSTSLYRSIQKTWRTSAGFWPQLVCQQTKLSSSLLLLFMSQPGSTSVFSKVILPGRHFILSRILPQLSRKDHEHLLVVSSRMFSQSPQLGYGTVRSGLRPRSRSVRFRRSRSLDAHAERRTSECTLKSNNCPLKTNHPFLQASCSFHRFFRITPSTCLMGCTSRRRETSLCPSNCGLCWKLAWLTCPSSCLTGEMWMQRAQKAASFATSEGKNAALNNLQRLIPQLWQWSVKTCTTKIVFIGDGFECKQRTLKTLQDSYTYIGIKLNICFFILTYKCFTVLTCDAAGNSGETSNQLNDVRSSHWH